MDDAVTPGAPGVAPQVPNTPPATPAPASPEAAPQYITVDQFAQLQASVVQRLDGMSGAISKLGKSAPAPAPESPEAGGGTAPPQTPRQSKADIELAAQQHELAKEVQALKANQAKLRQRTFSTFAREACAAAGVQVHAVEPMLAVMAARYGSRMAMNEQENGINILPTKEREMVEQPKPLDAVLGDYLKGDGAWALPPKSLPSGDGATGGARDFRGTDGKHKFSGLSYAAIGKARRSDPGAFTDYIINHKAEWQQKQQAALQQS